MFKKTLIDGLAPVLQEIFGGISTSLLWSSLKTKAAVPQRKVSLCICDVDCRMGIFLWVLDIKCT